MKLKIKESATDSEMLELFTDEICTILWAVVHTDFLCHGDFGGGVFQEGSALDRVLDGETLEFELTEVKR